MALYSTFFTWILSSSLTLWSFSQEPDASASLRFTGNAIAYYGTVSPDHADISVSIDNETVTMPSGSSSHVSSVQTQVGISYIRDNELTMSFICDHWFRLQVLMVCYHHCLHRKRDDWLSCSGGQMDLGTGSIPWQSWRHQVPPQDLSWISTPLQSSQKLKCLQQEIACQTVPQYHQGESIVGSKLFLINERC